MMRLTEKTVLHVKAFTAVHGLRLNADAIVVHTDDCPFNADENVGMHHDRPKSCLDGQLRARLKEWVTEQLLTSAVRVSDVYVTNAPFEVYGGHHCIEKVMWNLR